MQRQQGACAVPSFSWVFASGALLSPKGAKAQRAGVAGALAPASNGRNGIPVDAPLCHDIGMICGPKGCNQ